MVVFVPASKFPLGRLCATAKVAALVSSEDMSKALFRHALGDWGLVDEHDKAANDAAMKSDGRLLSVYKDSAGTDFWIITEAGRSATMIFLPEEY